MNKYIKIALVTMGIIVLMLLTMFGTYRYIMTHQVLECGENGTIYSTVFGQTDTYYVKQDHTVRIMDELYDTFSNSELADEYNITREDAYTINISK